MDLLLSLLIWLIIVIAFVAAVKILGPWLGAPPPVIAVILLVISCVALIALLILFWPFLTHPGGLGHWQH